MAKQGETIPGSRLWGAYKHSL